MMNPVWKCTACEFGPCYVQCDRRDTGSIFGDDDCGRPAYCPQTSEETPEFEPCAPEANPWSLRWIDMMQEWLMGEGYDAAPEEIRDGLAIDLHGRIEKYDAMRIIALLRDREEDASGGFFDREEWLKKMAKVSKWDLLNAVFPEAFKAGIIYGEMVRQRKSEVK
ncbi:MAG: hypothetical protein IJU70_06940 [Lentisphaeria bacterium]|nr:hypothetical protein [Lentisphaeria bacterium]